MTKLLSLTPSTQRWQVEIHGTVQGVGFRPFVFRLAQELSLSGFICNGPDGVIIEIEGERIHLETFMRRLEKESPEHATLNSIKIEQLPLKASDSFQIIESLQAPLSETNILPDLATCPQCLEDIFNPKNRRFFYPFTNCTHCGPRFSILKHLPFDRQNTSMKSFIMCADCENEYSNPANRRFHAQANACPTCGPQLSFCDASGNILSQHADALAQAIEKIRNGHILAIKGLGGFQLVVDARNENSVALLRNRKHREEKPFALMFPTLSLLKNYCCVEPHEEKILISPQSPILLLTKKTLTPSHESLAHSVCFENPRLGAMLPYTPLHHLLMRTLNFPVVATSANVAHEPMCIDNAEALTKLHGIADFFLMHDRPIVRPVDDSVGMFIKNKLALIRRARGYAPNPIYVEKSSAAVLAVGSQLKNTIALKVQDKIFLSQHIGDLETPEAVNAFTQATDDFCALYPKRVDYIAVDLHPNYFSSRYVENRDELIIKIQHHHAHIVSCMAEHNLTGPVLGLAWDGTGLGDDNTIWGGEFLVSTKSDYKRVGHLLPFRIPGGDASIKQPKRTALSLLFKINENIEHYASDIFPEKLFTFEERKNIHYMLTQGILSPETSSMGRLFDGVSSLLGLCHEANYEGQAAMLLEHAISKEINSESYDWEIQEESTPSSKFVLDWRPMLREIIADIKNKRAVSEISLMFHNTLVEMAVDMAKRIGEKKIVLSGGCFQNKYLTEKLIERLHEENFNVCWHSQIPSNDGGIALGQAVIAAERFENAQRK